MKRGQHRFHCTDGHSLIADMRGTWAHSFDDAMAKAKVHIVGLIAAMPAGLDWSEWIVDVHDVRGRRAFMLPFDAVPEAMTQTMDRKAA